jgi:hypothetical protein
MSEITYTQAEIDAAIQASRQSALEEAAKVCENPPARRLHAPPMFVDCTSRAIPSLRLAAAIRALGATKEGQQP